MSPNFLVTTAAEGDIGIAEVVLKTTVDDVIERSDIPRDDDRLQSIDREAGVESDVQALRFSPTSEEKGIVELIDGIAAAES